jgi:hypothetical protein
VSNKLDHYNWMLSNLELSEQHIWWINRQIREIEGEEVKI